MQIHTKKQKLYYDEVIRLHREYGYGECRISRILPIGHTVKNKLLEHRALGIKIHNGKEQTPLEKRMIARKRKTIALCGNCHKKTFQK